MVLLKTWRDIHDYYKGDVGKLTLLTMAGALSGM